ncbi:DUF2855 family protein [Iamia majanohamensis]|uniref:DUF2855 family protein n=1 Tax=Iamia majanohamensis TaxID=467976 RepID=A0AAE9Y6L2_9ACTN|nr:DUF2855 family protein [Iamia majanohamensis]WCO65189.1 DUF2855 family protein [Iamia majanohamensis]
MTLTVDALEVDRHATGTTRLVAEDLGALAPGRVRFRVDRFAVTANTVTYAELGDMLGYWGFYPTDDATWGRVPAMGWADVVASAHPEVEPGSRHYGWFPMAGHVDVEVRPTPAGLRDEGAHRAEHAAVYRTFEDSRTDPLYPDEADPEARADLEDRHALLRGLFLTGFLADASLASRDWFGAEVAVVLSASSKTAIGFATCARARGAVRLVGVTSPGHVEAVEALGLYDEVVTYDAVGSVPVVPAVAVDVAGDGRVVGALHERLGDRLAHSMVVGRTHNDAPPAAVTSGPEPELFFAPTAMEALRADGADLPTLLAASRRALTDFITGSRAWMAVERAHGPDAVAAAWADVHAGRVPPDVGRICSLHG